MDQKKEVVTEQYVCPNCGGSIAFDAKSSKLKCPYCDTLFEISQLEAFKKINTQKNIYNVSWENPDTKNYSEDEKNNLCQYTCVSCGAEIVTDKNTIATSCPYCSNAVVISDRMKDSYRPDCVIPFKVDKKTAIEKYKNYIQGKKFVPKDFALKNTVDKIQCLYAPFWLFSGYSTADSSFIGTKLRYYSDSSYDYIETSFYAVSRRGNFSFKNLPVDGSEKIDNKLMESIEPFMDEGIKEFSPGYLAGYMAERYDETSDICQKRADIRAKNMALDIVRQSVSGYDNLIEKSSNVSVKGEKPKYALMPIYIINTNYEGRKYTFSMNGQTGKFVGNMPVDSRRVTVYFLKCTAVSTLIIFFILLIIYYLYLNL